MEPPTPVRHSVCLQLRIPIAINKTTQCDSHILDQYLCQDSYTLGHSIFTTVTVIVITYIENIICA